MISHGIFWPYIAIWASSEARKEAFALLRKVFRCDLASSNRQVVAIDIEGLNDWKKRERVSRLHRSRKVHPNSTTSGLIYYNPVRENQLRYLDGQENKTKNAKSYLKGSTIINPKSSSLSVRNDTSLIMSLVKSSSCSKMVNTISIKPGRIRDKHFIPRRYCSLGDLNISGGIAGVDKLIKADVQCYKNINTANKSNDRIGTVNESSKSIYDCFDAVDPLECCNNLHCSIKSHEYFLRPDTQSLPTYLCANVINEYSENVKSGVAIKLPSHDDSIATLPPRSKNIDQSKNRQYHAGVKKCNWTKHMVNYGSEALSKIPKDNPRKKHVKRNAIQHLSTKIQYPKLTVENLEDEQGLNQNQTVLQNGFSPNYSHSHATPYFAMEYHVMEDAVTSNGEAKTCKSNLGEIMKDYDCPIRNSVNCIRDPIRKCYNVSQYNESI